MSIKIMTEDGRVVWDDDLAVAMREARNEDADLGVQPVLDHLELIAQVPAAFGESTSFAARIALELIRELAEGAGRELGIARLT